MPTNDERREVAARLREVRPKACVCGVLGWELACEYVECCEDCTRYALADLADLIEPEPERTCRIEINWDYDGDCPAYYRDYVCSECKEDFIYYKHSYINFCPNCGCKVVE